jgi:hypothetical protein
MGSLNSPRPKMARQVKSKFKSMLIVFFDILGIVHKGFVLAGQTVSSAYYCDSYWQLYKNVLSFVPNIGDKRTGCCIMTVHLFSRWSL